MIVLMIIIAGVVLSALALMVLAILASVVWVFCRALWRVARDQA